jgi:hypothetical protein
LLSAPKNLPGVSLVKSFSRSRVVIYVRVWHEPSDSLVRFQDVQAIEVLVKPRVPAKTKPTAVAVGFG